MDGVVGENDKIIMNDYVIPRLTRDLLKWILINRGLRVKPAMTFNFQLKI